MMWPYQREGLMLVSLLLVLAAGPALQVDDDEEGIVVEDDGYIRAGDILYKTEWKPRDCIGPVEEGDSVTMVMEYVGNKEGDQTVEMETAVTVRVGRGQTIHLKGEGLLGMCLGERRRLIVPTDIIRNEYKQVLPDLAVGVTTYLNIELVKLNSATWEKFPSGLLVALIETVGERQCGRTVIDGDQLAVEYEGSLENGTVFDSSRERGAPFGPFVQGRGQIIRGYEVALAGRCLGERFKMIVPPHLAYGDSGVGNLIPPGATLHFDVRLVQLNNDVWNSTSPNKDILQWEKVEGPTTCEKLAESTDDLYIHHYALREDGSSFGTLVDGSEPYGPFQLASNGLWNVVGLAQSVESMCLGDRRRVVVPPRLSWPGIHDTIQVWVDLVRINNEFSTNNLSTLVPAGPPKKQEL